MPRATLFRIWALLTVLLLVPACRTAAPFPEPSARRAIAGTRSTQRGPADILGCVEIQSATVDNAYDAVARFRPEFLKPRAVPVGRDPTEGLPVVYLDGVRQGASEMLRSIPVAAILEIRYLTGMAASAQLGQYHPGGVIAVRTRP